MLSKRAYAASEMGQRNRTVDLEMEQQQHQHHHSQSSIQPGPCILLSSFPPQQQQQPDNNNNNLPAMAASFPNLEARSLQDPTSYDMFYGLPQYHHHHQLHQPAPPPNYYVPYMAFQGPSSSSQGVVGVSSDQFMDHTRGAYKRKNAEGIPVMNHQSLSTLAAPFNNTPETIAPFGGPRSRPMNPVLPPPPPPPPPHAPNSFIQGSYPGHHPFPPPGSIWYEQHHGRLDGSPSFWPHPPYMHAGSIESSGRNPTAFMYPPRDHYYHHPPPPPPPPPPHVQGVRGQSATLYPPMASSSPSYGFPPGNFAPPQNTINRGGPSGSEMGPVQPTGFRIYQRDDSVPLAALRQHRGGVPRFRMMPDDEVAILEFGDFLGGGSGNNHIDHHRDMRLDIEEMSYEELLALSERIGTVNTGLPEEDVKNHLKTRTCSVINLAAESSSSSSKTKDRETEPCTICQESFKNEEKIATLDCGHEYHAGCLEKWLVVKNVCPICKAEVAGSTYELLVAHIWRCACFANEDLGEEHLTRLHIIIDGRSRLQPNLPQGYIGNTLFHARPISLLGEFRREPFSATVKRVHEEIKKMDNEYLRSAIDCLERHPDLDQLVPGEGNPIFSCAANFCIVGLLKQTVYELDFGWGRPFFKRTSHLNEGKGFVGMSLDEEGSFIVFMCLKKTQLSKFQKLFYEFLNISAL